MTSTKNTANGLDGSAPFSKEPLSNWERFVIRHSKRSNLRIHFVSFLMFWGGLFIPLIVGDYRWLGLFFISGLMGAFGHWVTGDGTVSPKEATRDPQVVFFVTLMFLKIAKGTYFREVEEAKKRYRYLCDTDGLEP